jgi:hypothetical protein
MGWVIPVRDFIEVEKTSNFKDFQGELRMRLVAVPSRSCGPPVRILYTSFVMYNLSQASYSSSYHRCFGKQDGMKGDKLRWVDVSDLTNEAGRGKRTIHKV